MEKKIQKYLDSYKRLYFRGEIQNSKTKNLLDKKRISLGLEAFEVEEITTELNKNFELVIGYVKDFLDLNYDGTSESLILDEFDKVDIEEFWRDVNLSDEDGARCLEFAMQSYKSNMAVELSSIKGIEEDFNLIKNENTTLNSEEKIFSNDLSFNNYINKSSNISDVEEEKNTLVATVNKEFSTVNTSLEYVLNQYKSIFTKAKRNEVNSMQMKFLNLILSYSISYENDIFSLENRKQLNEETLKNIFFTRFEDFLEEFMLAIKESGIISIDEVPNYRLEDIFDIENIKKYTAFLDQINDELDKGSNEEFLWMTKVALQYESAKVNTVIGRSTSDYIFRVLEECKSRRKYEGNISNAAFKTIDKLLIQMICNITSHAIFTFKNMTDSVIRGASEISKLIEAKQKAINYIDSAKTLNKVKDYDRYLAAIIDSLKEYPYYEDSHLEILDILDSNIDDERILLDFAHGIIMSAGESCDNINKKLIELNSNLYNSSIEELKRNDIEFMQLRGVCENLRQKFKINDVNTIVRCELHTFGKVISSVNYSDVDESLRLELYKDEIIALRSQDLDEQRKISLIRNLRNIYKINDDEIIIETEINNFGMIFSDVDFLKVDYEIRKDMFKKRIVELEYERDQDLLESKIIEYKQMYRIDTKFAMDLEISRFGRWFGELDLSGIDSEDLEVFIVKLSKTIMMLNLTADKKNILLNQLKEESGYSTKQFYEIQSKIGNKEMALNNEDSLDIEFIEKANEIYKRYPKMVLEEKLLTSNDSDFHCGVFIKQFKDIRETLRDEDLFLLRKSNNREGFLITSKAIYHSSWSNAVFIKDIKKIVWKEQSTLKSGQRYFRPYIHVITNLDDFRFDFVGFRQIDIFVKFLLDLVNTNRSLRGIEACEYESISIAESSLTVSQMLEGNEFKAKFEGHINTLDDVNEIYSFIANSISSNLKKIIKLQDTGKKLDSKIKNAIASYAPIEQKEVPLIAYDSTLFKSGKEGFMLTTKAIYCKNKFGTPWKVSHKDIKFIKLEAENLIFNDKQTTIAAISENERIEFRSLLEFCSYIFKVK